MLVPIYYILENVVELSDIYILYLLENVVELSDIYILYLRERCRSQCYS